MQWGGINKCEAVNILNKLTVSYFKVLPRIFVLQLNETTRNVSQDSLQPCLESNMKLSECHMFAILGSVCFVLRFIERRFSNCISHIPSNGNSIVDDDEG
jgi:hypothetical protein